jgi:hypothetical protein
MATTKKAFEAVKKASEEMTSARIKAFVKSLEGNLPSVNGQIQWSAIKGKEYPATTIDNWLRRAQDHGRLDGVSLNRVAFELWKRLEELGAVITKHDTCMIVPAPEIESKLARAVEKEFAKGK